jgi:PAS domain S-box-containing protein
MCPYLLKKAKAESITERSKIMTKKKIGSLGQPDDLRRQAEEIVRKKALQRPENLDTLSPEEQRHLLHELQVHQIELTMQNEALHQTQEELESSRMRYFNLYDLAPMAYFTLSEEGLILEANLTASSLLGLARSALVQKPLTRFIFREDQDLYYHHRQQLFKTGAAQVCELRLLKKDSSLFWARLESTVTQDSESGDTGVTLCPTVISDITERKQAEEALRTSEARYRLLVENANEVIVVAQDGMLKFVNRMTVELFGYSEQELTSRPFPEFVHPNDRGMVVERHLKRLKGDVFQPRYAFRLVARDGSIKWVEIGAVLINWEGKPATLNFLNDITERKQAEEELRKSEARFRGYFNLPLHGIAITSPDKGWIEVNDRLCLILGYTRDELFRMNWKELTHPDDLAADTEQFNRVLFGQIEQYTMDKRFIRKNGGVIWTNITVGCVRKSNGSVDYFIGLMEDITERKKAEEALRIKDWAIESAINAISTSDLAGNLNYVNPMFLKMWGYSSPAEVLGKPAVGFWQMGEKAVDVIEALHNKGGWVGELVAQRKDGTLFDVQVSASMVVNAAGQSVCMQASFADITERIRNEEKLRYQANLLENVSDAIIATDLQYNIQFWNKAAERQYGWTASEVIGHPLEMFIINDYLGCSLDVILQKISQDGYWKGEVTQNRLDGVRIPVISTVSIVTNIANQPSGFIAVNRDITERKQAELLILVQRDLALAISFSHQLDEALLKCLDTMLQLSEMECGGIYLIDQASGDLNLICHRNLSPAFIKSVSHYKADSTRARLVLQGKSIFTRYSGVDLPLSEVEKAEKLKAFAVLPLIFEKRVIGCLNLGSQKLEDISEINKQVLKTAATLMGEGITRLKIEEELKLSYQKLQRALENTIQAMALVLEIRDPYTAGHQKRVAELACTIAKEIGFSLEKINRIYMEGIIHDIGKINVPTEILSKPGSLSEIELKLIQTHPQAGSDMLKEMELPEEVCLSVLQHHERMDGSGYPSGLSGKDIILEARILAVADVVEAITSHRPYRPALGLDKALEEITQNKGKLYDPQVVDACLKLFKEKGFKF